MAICDYCQYNSFDEETGEYYCSVDLDEDEIERFMNGNDKECVFYKPFDEYKLVQKQN